MGCATHKWTSASRLSSTAISPKITWKEVHIITLRDGTALQPLRPCLQLYLALSVSFQSRLLVVMLVLRSAAAAALTFTISRPSHKNDCRTPAGGERGGDRGGHGGCSVDFDKAAANAAKSGVSNVPAAVTCDM